VGAFVQGLGFRASLRSITWMSVGSKSPRTQVWLESLGEWTWPGQRAVAAEVLPPAWVPTFPPAGTGAPAPALPAGWERARRLTVGLLLSALAAVCAALALGGQLGIDLGGARASVAPARTAPAQRHGLLPAPSLHLITRSDAGSTIGHASYRSVALHHTGSFYVYLPPGYRAATATRYPVIYLLHGNSQAATAFLRIGIQGELDRLISAHAIPPMIAVMVQGGGGANNWRNIGDLNYESYVLEVQEMIDHMLPTVAARSGRAIAGLSMGGYGAMELTLDNPYRFSVVESWLGFFNGLEDELRLDRRAIARLGLHAFLYGAAADKIANPTEDAPFAAQLRAAGASASSAVYPGEHNLETIEAHLAHMLTFAGQSLQQEASRAGQGAR
jgi:enterochelin esterase-like enzyme